MGEFRKLELTAALGELDAGVNAGVSPLILPPNQLASATNCTVRGTYAKKRPNFRKIPLTFEGDIQAAATKALFQGAAFFTPDNLDECLMAAIGGRLFQFTPADTTASVTERTIPADPNPATRPQAWLWQAEKWLIWNDGVSLPVFFDGVSSVRSVGPIEPPPALGPIPLINPYQNWIVPAIGGAVPITFQLTTTGNYPGSNNDIIIIGNGATGQFEITAGAGSSTLTLRTVSSPVVGVAINGTAEALPITIAISATANEPVITPQLPPGRMGVYGLGRNWVCLVDGKQFVASDIVGGSSGTPTLNYRDAVLNVTENSYLAGGGNFTVPGSVGDIQAMRFAATLDASLGQGPLQVFTEKSVFSCNAPVDRLTWQDLTNPILTQSLISNGALGQNSTINVNGDIMFRAVDGIRSLILARRDFSTWGNVPQSREVEPLLELDEETALPWSSSIVFDNRLLMTASPRQSALGIYFKALIPLNFDPISSLRGKAPAVYDSLAWTGLNVLQLIVGSFNRTERAFAFTLNTITNEIELYEILKESQANEDNDTTSPVKVVWSVESASLFRYPQLDPRAEMYKRLADGEIFVDQLEGEVTFQAFYRPDQWPCWVPWHTWKECSTQGESNGRPQFRPRMGLGEPAPDACDGTNNRPLREGFTFQFKLIITGKCRFLGARLRADTIPQPQFTQPSECCSVIDQTNA